MIGAVSPGSNSMENEPLSADPDGRSLLTRVRAADERVRRTVRAMLVLWVLTTIFMGAGTVGSTSGSSPKAPMHLFQAVMVLLGVGLLVLSLIWSYLAARALGRRNLIFKNTSVGSGPAPEPEIGEKFGPLRVIDIDDHTLHLAYQRHSALVVAQRVFMVLLLLAGLVACVRGLIVSMKVRSVRWLVIAPILLWRYFKPTALQFLVASDDNGRPVFTVEMLRYVVRRRLIEVKQWKAIDLRYIEGTLVARLPLADPALAALTKPVEVRLVTMGSGRAAQWHARRLIEAIGNRFERQPADAVGLDDPLSEL